MCWNPEVKIIRSHVYPAFSGVRVTRSLVLCVCFVDRCLPFRTFSFDDLVLRSNNCCIPPPLLIEMAVSSQVYRFLTLLDFGTVLTMWYISFLSRTSYPSGAPQFTPGFQWGLCYSIFSFTCMFFRRIKIGSPHPPPFLYLCHTHTWTTKYRGQSEET
jgi:hypothetical protein